MAVGTMKKRRRSKIDAGSDPEWSGAEGEDLPNDSDQRRILTRTALNVDVTASLGDNETSEELTRTASTPSIGKSNGKKITKGRKSRVTRANPNSDSEWSGAEGEDFPKDLSQRTRPVLTRKTVHFDDTAINGEGQSSQEFARTTESTVVVEKRHGRRVKRQKRLRANHSSDSEWSGAGEENVEHQNEKRTGGVLTRRLAACEGISTRATGSAPSSPIDARVCAGSNAEGCVAEGRTFDNQIVHDDDRDLLPPSQNVLDDKRDESTSEGAVVCGICLSEGVEPLDRGKLDCCDHFFCFMCIMEWAKVESRCPLCKQRFVTIIKPPRADFPRGRGRTVRIPTRNQVYVPPEEEARIDVYSNTVCMECQRSSDESLLLLCDGCDSAAHTYCVGLGRSVPRGDWYCSSCSSVFVDDASSSSDDDFELELPEHLSSAITALTAASLNILTRTRRTGRVSSRPRPRRQGSGRRKRRRSGRRGANGTYRVGTRQLPSRLRSSSRANARTLTQQRRLQDRINHMRRNWSVGRSVSALSSGTLNFSSVIPSHDEATLTNSSVAFHENTSKTSPKQDTLKVDIEKAWQKLKQARALRSMPDVETQRKPTEPHEHQGMLSKEETGDFVSHQFSGSRLAKDNEVSPDHLPEDYERGTSVSDVEPKRRMNAGIYIRGESSNGNPINDAAKVGQANKAGEAEAFTYKTDLKGKAPMPPDFEETSMGRHHERYEGQDANSNRGAFEGTSRDMEGGEGFNLSSMKQYNIFSGFQEPGKLTNGCCYELNGMKGFFKVDGCLQDESNERYDPIHSNQSHVQDERRDSPNEVGVSGTPALRHDDHRIQLESEKDLKLEHLKKGFPSSNKELPQFSMASEVKANPFLSGSSNHVNLRAPLYSPNSVQMKYQDYKADEVRHHKGFEKIELGCLSSLTTDLVDTNLENRTSLADVLNCENTVKASQQELSQRQAIKDRVLKIISQNLKPLLKSRKIGKDEYKEIARSTTHHLLAAYGLEHSKRLVHSVEVISCCHLPNGTMENGLQNFCDECLNLQVTKVLDTLLTELLLAGKGM